MTRVRLIKRALSQSHAVLSHTSLSSIRLVTWRKAATALTLSFHFTSTNVIGRQAACPILYFVGSVGIQLHLSSHFFAAVFRSRCSLSTWIMAPETAAEYGTSEHF